MTSSKPTVLHYVTQWLWLSDTFVHGPVTATEHGKAIVSRGEIINQHVYPYPGVMSLTEPDGSLPDEGAPTADVVMAKLGGARPALVHLHHGYGLPDARAIARRLSVPLITSFWGYDITALPKSDPARFAGAFEDIDRVVVPSRYLARLAREAGASEEQIRIIPGGLDCAFFEPTPLPSAPRVAFVGRFVEKKGIDVLLRAWESVRAEIPDAELTLLGYGEQAPETDAGAGIRVLTPDPAEPRKQVRDLLRRSRLYVSPSRTAASGDGEGQHMGNLEAQASGRPVVTTAHTAIPEFVLDGETGLVVPENDVDAVAEAIVALLRDDERSTALAKNGTAWAQNFDVSVAARRHDELYAEVIGAEVVD